MVYPIFTLSSIQERLNEDIDNFTTIYRIKNNTELDTELTNITSETINTIIKKSVDYINSGIGANTYVDIISKLPPEVQNQMWIARTCLFYQILAYLTFLLNTKEEYNKIFKVSDKSIIYKEFNNAIIEELPNFKMGIFGSLTPTSDIDLGIQYSGTTINSIGLSYIICNFENLFLLLTNYKSIDYDIETYADMITIPNNNPSESIPDYFYLNSDNFTEKHFLILLPIIGKSIIRNFILSNIQMEKTELDNLSFSTIQKNNSLFNINHLLDSSIIETINNENPDTTWFNQTIKDEMYTFLKVDTYNIQRNKYYDAIDIAERKKLDYNIEKKIYTLNEDETCNLMFLIGNSLAYRIESYLCVPTVIHVVRILQASKDNLIKYNTLIPSSYCLSVSPGNDPFCSLNKFGYLISILEQIGYIYRFYLTYCINNEHKDELKCLKKEKKYMNRYIHAIINITKFKPCNQSNTLPKSRLIQRPSPRVPRQTKILLEKTEQLVKQRPPPRVPGQKSISRGGFINKVKKIKKTKKLKKQKK